MTSLDDAFSKKWERNAGFPGDRIAALKAFHDAGIFTWVSLEPTLDCESSLKIVCQTHGFVDLFKIGRVNYLPMTKTTDWETYTHRMTNLCQKLKVSTTSRRGPSRSSFHPATLIRCAYRSITNWRSEHEDCNPHY